MFVCDPKATCKNLDGGYGCVCASGYTGDGKICDDIDECANKTACKSGEVCTNKLGSFSCACKAGWVAAADGCVPGP